MSTLGLVTLGLVALASPALAQGPDAGTDGTDGTTSAESAMETSRQREPVDETRGGDEAPVVGEAPVDDQTTGPPESTRPTEARAHQSVGLAFEGCDGTLEAALRAALDVELIDAEAAVHARLASSRVRVMCDEGGVDVSMSADADGAAAEQRIVATEPAFERRVALTIVELLAAYVATSPADAPETPPESTTAEERASTEHAVSVFLRAHGGIFYTQEPIGLLPSASVALEVAPVRELVVDISLAGQLGGFTVRSGSVELRTLSLALSLRAGFDLGWLVLHAGPTVRGGFVSWSGHPNDPSAAIGHDAIAPWIGLGGALRARVPVVSVLSVELEVECGGIAVSSTAIASGEGAAALGGGWLAVGLGVALELG